MGELLYDTPGKNARRMENNSNRYMESETVDRERGEIYVRKERRRKRRR